MISNNSSPENFIFIQMLGMVNAMKTGNPQVDMLIAMALPYLLNMLRSDLLRWIKKLVAKEVIIVKADFERNITHRSTVTAGGVHVDIDEENYNLCLIKALQLYVYSNCKPDLKQAEMNLTLLGGNSSQQRRNDMSTSDLLKSFSMVERPLSKQWLDVGTFADSPVKLFMEDSLSNGKEDGGNNGGTGSIRDMTIQVKSPSKQSINAFLQVAFDWYTDQLKSMENTDRFLFELESCSSRGREIPNFRRYKLGDDKTFESLFSRQCHDLLTIVDQFESKSGKYRIKGYPHKLGLLLTGPPGTGKTSLIKALAHYTDRHIVNVLLSRISTNASLMNLMFNKKYITNDSGAHSSLDFNRIIYVFEDVDASSDVVKSRKLIAEESAEAGPVEVVEASAAKASKDDNKARKRAQMREKMIAKMRADADGEDKLDLTGLLNALDGVVDTPGRIVIMTSNHPEILDEALVRPGRIDKRLNLGYMIAQDMVEMLEHYFECKVDSKAEIRIRALIQNGMDMTAAELEQLAIEHETTEELIASLEKRE
ncbi:unnamed protein product [Cylindrotheca closterium]|uniref:AAA+ ATPase domain-containing protein n=1 Tax=Cylindrotheca closterium TaxID=2856 RepID=A0AAD2CTG5_9STRA|nr:unnamed protein product [Cylindrotheca closterium]